MGVDREGRYCRCGSRLARDNPDRLCSPCQATDRGMVTGPPDIGPAFWATDQMRDALDSWHIGRVIAAYRHHAHHGRVLRQDLVAGWMGITQAQLSRIENGSPVADLHKLRHWADVLGIPADLLWFKLSRTAADSTPPGAGTVCHVPRAGGQSLSVDTLGDANREIEDMNRRELLRLIGIAAASLATAPVGVAGPDVSMVAEVMHTGAVEQYGPLNAQLWQMYAAAQTKGAVLPLVRSHLDALTGHLRNAPSAGRREVFAGLLADMLQLAGEISFDLNHYTDAAHCYTLAATASKEANNPDLWACALTRQSFISVYERQFDAALPLLESASRLAGRGDTQLSTRYWVSTVKAHTFAGMGDITSCQRSLDHAEGVHHLTTPPETTGWLRFNGSRLAEERGTCFVELHRHDLAETSLTRALGQGMSERRKGSIYTDLAVVGVQRNDTDYVTTWAGQALDAARHTKSGYVLKKLGSLQTRIRQLLDNRSMRDLNEQITHVVKVSTTT